MRVKSALWVAALIRRAQSAGAFVAVLHKGNEEAGTIFIVTDDRSGTQRLLGPAPQIAYEPGADMDRKFECLLDKAKPADVSDRLARERSFDPDIWVVEIEDRQGRDFVLDP